ncbi:MAG: hypothetical protein Q9182_006687 [Xanthomendoza sp. 2 TL-2023]
MPEMVSNGKAHDSAMSGSPGSHDIATESGRAGGSEGEVRALVIEEKTHDPSMSGRPESHDNTLEPEGANTVMMSDPDPSASGSNDKTQEVANAVIMSDRDPSDDSMSGSRDSVVIPRVKKTMGTKKSVPMEVLEGENHSNHGTLGSMDNGGAPGSKRKMGKKKTEKSDKKPRVRPTFKDLKEKFQQFDPRVPMANRKTDDQLIKLASSSPPSTIQGPAWYKRHAEAPYCYSFGKGRLLSEYYYLVNIQELEEGVPKSVDGSPVYKFKDVDIKRVVDNFKSWILAQRHPGAYGVRGLRERATRTLEDTHARITGEKGYQRGQFMKVAESGEAKKLARMTRQDLTVALDDKTTTPDLRPESKQRMSKARKALNEATMETARRESEAYQLEQVASLQVSKITKHAKKLTDNNARCKPNWD